MWNFVPIEICNYGFGIFGIYRYMNNYPWILFGVYKKYMNPSAKKYGSFVFLVIGLV